MSELREKESGPAESVPSPHYQGTHYHGSAYGMTASHKGYLRPVGEWNTARVVCKCRQQLCAFLAALQDTLAG